MRSLQCSAALEVCSPLLNHLHISLQNKRSLNQMEFCPHSLVRHKVLSPSTRLLNKICKENRKERQGDSRGNRKERLRDSRKIKKEWQRKLG